MQLTNGHGGRRVLFAIQGTRAGIIRHINDMARIAAWENAAGRTNAQIMAGLGKKSPGAVRYLSEILSRRVNLN